MPTPNCFKPSQPHQRWRAIALACALGCAAAMAHAAPVLVGTDPAAADGGFGLGFSFAPDVNLVIAQQFSIGSAAATVGGISVWLNGLGTGSFTLQVVDTIGASATAANVLLSLTGSMPNITGGHQEVAFSGLSLALAASTDYYLVLSSAAGPDTGWGTTTTASLPGMPGSVGPSFVGIAVGGAVGDYTLLDPANPNSSTTQFRIDSAVGAPGGTVPLPSSLALAGLALLAVAGLQRPSLGQRRPQA